MKKIIIFTLLICRLSLAQECRESKRNVIIRKPLQECTWSSINSLEQMIYQNCVSMLKAYIDRNGETYLPSNIWTIAFQNGQFEMVKMLMSTFPKKEFSFDLAVTALNNQDFELFNYYTQNYDPKYWPLNLLLKTTGAHLIVLQFLMSKGLPYTIDIVEKALDYRRCDTLQYLQSLGKAPEDSVSFSVLGQSLSLKSYTLTEIILQMGYGNYKHQRYNPLRYINDVKTIDLLRRYNVDLTTLDENGENALFQQTNIEVVKELLRLGVNARQITRYGMSVLYSLTNQDLTNTLPIWKLLIEAGADIEAEYRPQSSTCSYSLIARVASLGTYSRELIEDLLQRGASVDRPNWCNYPLPSLAENLDFPLVRILLDRGARAYVPGKVNFISSLMKGFSNRRNKEISFSEIKYFIDEGLRKGVPKEISPREFSGLYELIRSTDDKDTLNMQVIKYLVQAGLSLNVPDHEKKCALDYADYHHDTGAPHPSALLVKYLKSKGAVKCGY